MDSSLLVIREFTKEDEFACQELMKNYVLSFVKTAFFICLFKEITIQSIVVTWAVLFIFFGVPLSICFCCVPICILILFLSVYVSSYSAAVELANVKKNNCWVVEAYEPYSFQCKPKTVHFTKINRSIPKNKSDIRKLRKTIIGTGSFRSHNAMDNAGWICHFAVDKNYPFEQISQLLLETLLKQCQNMAYDNVELAISELQEQELDLCNKMGFTTRLIYHKKIIGNSLIIMKSQLGMRLSEFFEVKKDFCALDLDL